MSICLVVTTLVDPDARIGDFFREAVHGAAVARGYDPSAPSALYLAGLLSDYARPEALTRDPLRKPVTLAYHEALATVGPERFQRLRQIGDDTLYFSGFFQDHLERRGAPVRFVHSLGRAAYDSASAMLRRGGEAKGPDVFDELSAHFGELVLVLGEVSDALYAAGARDSRGVLDVYERWERRGSRALADVLLSWGLLPVRRSDQIH